MNLHTERTMLFLYFMTVKKWARMRRFSMGQDMNILEFQTKQGVFFRKLISGMRNFKRLGLLTLGIESQIWQLNQELTETVIEFLKKAITEKKSDFGGLRLLQNRV